MSKPIQAKKRIDVTPGESVRIIRELQGLSQNELSALCGIPQTTISSIETGRQLIPSVPFCRSMRRRSWG